MTRLDIGSAPTLQATFRDADGVLVDPSTVTLTVEDPAGTETAWTGGDLTHPSTGVYRRVVELDQAGNWRWRWVGETANGTAVDEGVICVKASAFVGVS